MSLMSMNSFVEYFFPFRYNLSLHMEYDGMMLEMEIMRIPTLKIPKLRFGIVVSPTFLWVSRPLLKRFSGEENFWEWINNEDNVWFQRKNRMENPFDPERIDVEMSKADWSVDGYWGDYMIRKELNQETYFWLINKNNELRSRFFPLRAEKRVYMYMLEKYGKLMFPNGVMNLENINEMIDLCKETYQETRFFYEFNYLTKKHVPDLEEIMTMEDTKTYYETELKFGLNVKNLSTWLKARHNLFGVCILSEMNMKIPHKFDVNLVEELGYNGLYDNKTPDYILVDEDKITLIDFAVTKGDMLMRVDEKWSHYGPLISDLSKMTGKEVDLEVVVWGIEYENSFYLPERFERIRSALSHNTMLKEIRSMHMQIKFMDSYDLISKNLDSSTDSPEMDLEVKKEHYITLMSSLLNLYNLEGKTTYDVSDSRKKNVQKNMKKFKDFEIFPDLVDVRNMNEAEYYHEVKDNLVDIIKTGEVPSHLDTVFNRNMKKMRDKISESMRREENIRDNLKTKKFNLKKIFKFPYLELGTDNDRFSTTPMLFNFEHSMDDGTLFINEELFPEDQMEEDYLEEGIGINEGMDEELMQGLYDFLVDKDINKETSNYAKELDNKIFYQDLKQSNLWKLVCYVGDLMENVAYMEGRRHLFDKSSGHTVMKAFNNYILFMRKGSKLTASKQVRFKLMARKSSLMFTDSEIFHNWKEFNSDFMMTKWLSLAITDIEHLVKVREVTLSYASDYYDRKMEMLKSEKAVETILDKSFVMSIVIYLEHRRGTSTSLQLNRYLLHSASSYMTNREKLIEDINADPIRSRLEAYIRARQLRWYEAMLDRYDELNMDRVMNMVSTKTDYDRVYFPSFFDFNLRMEFGMMMNEIYLCNLFNKEAGFPDHRLKQVVKKMTIAEWNFQTVKEEDWSKGTIEDLKEFWRSKDGLHMFDKKFVAMATKRYFKNPMNQVLMLDAMTEACMEVVDSAMMMTASLTGGKYKSKVLEFKDKVTKTKSFLSLFELLEDMPSHLLISMVSMEETVEAIFTIFPKSQIGGPREILIQAVMLRVMVKFLETMAYKMSSKHKKEMITKDQMKAKKQSETMSKYKEEMMSLKKKGVPSIMASFNSDASKWAPGFVMEHFMHMVFNFETDDRLKDLLCTTISSFSHKVMLTPDSLREKWMRKPNEQKEFSEAIELYREMDSKAEGAPVFESGMGQGMFHKLSSLYHSIMDDTVDDLLEDILMEVHGTKIDQETLISSDDKTKMILMQFSNLQNADSSFKTYLLVLDMTYRLANIHTNWKKSGLQFIITEFNSLFSIGKRMMWATVKDIYQANSIPDLTAPEDAVKFMLSSIRRCFEHGVYLNTIDTMMVLARNQLKRYYRYDDWLVKDICEKLNTEEDNLPYQLGFMPLDFHIETMVFGLEFHMFKKRNSPQLMDFYKGLYTANNEFDTKRSRHYIPFDETGSGKFWIELPTKLDKKVIEMKNAFYEDVLKLKQDEVIKKMNLDSINVNLSRQDILNHNSFKRSYFVGMNRKYEFQETMVVHSLIRALQMSTKKAVIFPKTKEMVELEDILMSKNSTTEEKARARNDLEYNKVGVMEFLDFCLSRSHMKSSLNMMVGMKKVCDMSDQVHKKLSNMTKSNRMNHPTMYELRFNLEEYKSSFQKNDLINFIFDRSSDFKNSSLKAFEKMCLLFGMRSSEVWSNPFKFIRETLNDKDYCYKAFIEFVNYMSKVSGNTTMKMLSDFPDSGNLKINLTNLYRSRTSPLYMLDHPNDLKPSTQDMSFLTKMSFQEWDKIKEERVKGVTILSEDNKITRTRKLCSFGLDNVVKMSNVKSQRLFYKKINLKRENQLIHVWTDFSFLVIATEFIERGTKHVVMDIKAYSRESVEENLLFTAVKRYMADMVGAEMRFRERSITSRDGKYLYSVVPDQMKYKVNVVYYTTKYKVFLNILDKNNGIIAKIMTMEDPYSFSTDMMDIIRLEKKGEYSETLTDAMSNPPPLEILDDILLENNWVNKKLLTKYEDPTEEEMRLYDISSINQHFSQVGVIHMLPKMLEMNFSSSEEEKEEMEDNTTKEMIGLFSQLSVALSKAMGEEDEEVENNRTESHEMTSVSFAVERIVKSSVYSYLDMNNKLARDYFKHSKGNLTRFHNLMLWALHDVFPSISDTMLLMIYNIKLKEISMSTFINDVKNLELVNPSEQAKRTLRSRPIFSKVTEELRMDREDVLNNF
nr:MAG: RNA-dependent RNA polymerase [Fusarium oxysporum f. sp. cubense negative-stranded RNA virus 2]